MSAPAYGLSKCRYKSTVKVATFDTMIPRRPSYSPIQSQVRKKITRDDDNLKEKSSSSSNNRVTDVLRLMDSMHFPVPADMYASLLKECTDLKDIVGGAEVHAHMNNHTTSTYASQQHSLPPPPPRRLLLATRLLLMYASCGHLDSARQVFDKMTTKDPMSWLIMIAAHVDHNSPEEALHLFTQMTMQQPRQRYQNLRLINMSIPSVLRACIHTEDFGLGKQVHGLVFKLGQTEDLITCTSFIDLYAKFRRLDDSQRVFDQVLPRLRDTVTWTSLMVAYCKAGYFEVVIELFKKMSREGVKKNGFTISTVLCACGRFSRGAEKNEDDRGLCGKQVHANAIKLGVVESHLYVQCSLVDMYGKCGLMKDSRMAFDWRECSSDVCWSAMVNTYMQHGSYKEAIKLLYLMKNIGIEPPESILTSLRIACAGS
ncbi:pentatricopeptide repeat-containing protein At1g31790-like [Papaver somniferum]|uniref:pentatricopeptide repeat-containing protein At1g31790-like n=1 Tax=Papaver somniferum TaxID=3469 RepID=UPI000E7026B3|nr:pentatricopeptide repeat-containing protein At1g31790-like [Papaver somniferum]